MLTHRIRVGERAVALLATYANHSASAYASAEEDFLAAVRDARRAGLRDSILFAHACTAIAEQAAHDHIAEGVTVALISSLASRLTASVAAELEQARIERAAASLAIVSPSSTQH